MKPEQSLIEREDIDRIKQSLRTFTCCHWLKDALTYIEQLERQLAAPAELPPLPDVTDTDSARKFLFRYLVMYAEDKTFLTYVRDELAGDFAYHLARAIAAQRAAPTAQADTQDILTVEETTPTGYTRRTVISYPEFSLKPNERVIAGVRRPAAAAPQEAPQQEPVAIIQALIDSHKRDVGGECDAGCDIVAGMEAARDAISTISAKVPE